MLTSEEMAQARKSNMELGSSRNTTVRLRVKGKTSPISRGKVIETMFLVVEIPLIRVFGENPYSMMVYTEKEASKL